jgi:hypothetical protein
MDTYLHGTIQEFNYKEKLKALKKESKENKEKEIKQIQLFGIR